MKLTFNLTTLLALGAFFSATGPDIENITEPGAYFSAAFADDDDRDDDDRNDYDNDYDDDRDDVDYDAYEPRYHDGYRGDSSESEQDDVLSADQERRAISSGWR